MRLIELFENVIPFDFAKARANREQQVQVQQKQSEIEQEDEKETQTVQELAEFEEWMLTAKKKGRVPGFETMDDVIHFIIAEVEMPNHITRAKAIEWFGDISEEDREKARMIAHHADRMIDIYKILRNKIHTMQDMWKQRFGGKIPQGWDATDGAAWLDQEFTYDIKVLDNLKKAIKILGQ